MLTLPRLGALAVMLGCMTGCPDSDLDLNSSPLDPTHEFETLPPNVDTDWPIDRDPDTETETESDSGT